MKVDIVRSKATHVLCCMGRTHGTRDGKKFTTIDYLEHPEKLHENINDNLFSPLSLALLCQQRNIHFTYIGTGCIFTYDDKHSVEDGVLSLKKMHQTFLVLTIVLLKDLLIC